MEFADLSTLILVGKFVEFRRMDLKQHELCYLVNYIIIMWNFKSVDSMSACLALIQPTQFSCLKY